MSVHLPLSSGAVSIPATFHGTARLVDGAEPPTPPRPARHDELSGTFEAAFEPSFALLLQAGFVPVAPSHPFYPNYLAARDAPEPAALSHAIDPHSPDAVIVPFETVVPIGEAMLRRYGLRAPGGAGQEADEAAASPPPRRRPVPPLWHAQASAGAERRATPPPVGDFAALLDFLGDPERHPPPGG